jgi:hypothetical protein
LRIAPVVDRKWVEIVAGNEHQAILTPVLALVANIIRALNVEVPAKPIGAHADTEHAGVHGAELPIYAITPAQTKLRRRAAWKQRTESPPEPENDQTTPPI